MNIVYIQDLEINYCNGEFYHSKSEHFFERYLSGLTEDDTLTVCCGIKEIADKNIVKKYKNISNPRIRYVKIPEFRKLRNLFLIYKQVYSIVRNADFCYLRCGIASFIAGFYCKKHSIPYMAIVNEDVYKNLRNHSNFLFRQMAYPLSFLTHYIVKKADYACYVTQSYLQSRYPCKGRTIGCSDIEFLELDANVLYRRINKISKKSTPIILGSVGSVATRIKGQDTVIRVLAKLKNEGISNYRYLLVGTGNQKKLRALAKELGVSDLVEFLGEYSHDDVLKWFETIDIYIHPSRTEGLPRTILEAMTKATPCICSEVGGVPELINKDFLFHYNGSEIDELKRLIVKMDINTMEKEATMNFERAKLYNPHMLAIKRSAFFVEAISKARKINHD